MPAIKHLTYKDTKMQSLAVFGQFGEKLWIPNAKENVQLEHRNSHDLQNMGLGKVMVMVAMGASLEKHIDTLREYRDRYDLICCDKAFVPLMDKGIRPDFVMLCDASIPARHFETHVHATKGIKLIATPYANTLWTKSWLGPRYFYVNKDTIETEKIFLEIFGEDTRVIPASSNVSNAMAVFMTGSDENKRINWGGYEKYFLVGYDYSWKPEGNYYAWSDPAPKRNYMHHLTYLDMNHKPVFTSQNLMFSARWLYDYITMHKMPIWNASGEGILSIPARANLKDALAAVSPDRGRQRKVKEGYRLLQSITQAKVQAESAFTGAREAIWQ